jgi:CheY-like chemotaxis protein
MPEVDGFHLYKKIRDTDKRVKIIFLTASEFYYEQFRREHGFDVFKQEFFLRKPIETEDLVQAINKLLGSD